MQIIILISILRKKQGLTEIIVKPFLIKMLNLKFQKKIQIENHLNYLIKNLKNNVSGYINIFKL